MFYSTKLISLLIMMSFLFLIAPNENKLFVSVEEIESSPLKKQKINISEFNDSIAIFGNEEFLNNSKSYNWEGNGLVSNPIIIRDYVFNLHNESLIRINIQNTTYHFEIKNVTVNGGYTGILLNGVSNANIINNTMINNRKGFIFVNI